MSESKTPRTDDEAEDAHNIALYDDCKDKGAQIETEVVPASFARVLETELAAMTAGRDTAREQLAMQVAINRALMEAGIARAGELIEARECLKEAMRYCEPWHNVSDLSGCAVRDEDWQRWRKAAGVGA